MYVEIKHPFAYLSKDGDTVIFFRHNVEKHKENPIASWDDISMNYPRWCLATHTVMEAIIRVTEMVENEGWELFETTVEELTSFIT